MRRLHYAWIVAAVGLVTLITAAGFRSTTGILIVPLQDEFGWSRATISVAVAINLVVYGLGGPFAAALVERFGSGSVATAGRSGRPACCACSRSASSHRSSAASLRPRWLPPS